MSYATKWRFKRSAPAKPLPVRDGGRGLTLIEILVAASILTVSLLGLSTAWLFTVRSSASLDDRAAANECARLVMERAHGVGYYPQGYAPGTNTAPASEPVENYRFFDASLGELAASNAGSMPKPPPLTAYTASTSIQWIHWASGNPAYRDDQDLMQVTVTIQRVGPDGSLSDALVTLQSILTEGGL